MDEEPAPEKKKTKRKEKKGQKRKKKKKGAGEAWRDGPGIGPRVVRDSGISDGEASYARLGHVFFLPSGGNDGCKEKSSSEQKGGWQAMATGHGLVVSIEH